MKKKIVLTIILFMFMIGLTPKMVSAGENQYYICVRVEGHGVPDASRRR